MVDFPKSDQNSESVIPALRKVTTTITAAAIEPGAASRTKTGPVLSIALFGGRQVMRRKQADP